MAEVSIYAGPPDRAFTMLSDVDANSKPTYQGWALSTQLKTGSLTVVSVSKAADASFVITGHGLVAGNSITIASASGDWAGINGVKTVKAVTDADTFTIEDNTSAYAGSFDGAVTTLVPSTALPIWAISLTYYDANGNASAVRWAAGSSATNQIWSNRASLNYQ